MKKNIILLVTDTFRYDNLGDKAERPVRTPYLDRFAAERATAIENFWAGSFPTIPHRTDLAQGRLGWPHYGWQPIEDSGPNHIGRMLQSAGYATQIICDCPHLFRAGFQDGFDAAFHVRGQEGDKHLLHLNDPVQIVLPDAKTRPTPRWRDRNLANQHRWTNRYFTREEDSFPARTGSTVIRWLEENSQAGPFFLWADFFDPHEPWDPPEYLVRRYDPDYDGTPMIHPNYGPTKDFTPDEVHNMWAHYAAEAELVDRWLGRIIEKVDDLGLWDDSILVVTSDHGHSVGDHKRTGKSNINPHDRRWWPIYPEIGRVPFLIAGGEVPRGASLEMIGQPIDILPTLSELAGAAVEPPEPFDGRSFAAALLEGVHEHREFAVSGSCWGASPDEVPRQSVTPFVANREWGYTPVGADGKPELYDLAADPYAKRNLARRNAAMCRKMHDHLLAHLRENRAGRKLVKFWRELAP
jgi:arylsulfatase A-like enzyme